VPLTCSCVICGIRGDDIDDIFRIESKLPGLELPQELGFVPHQLERDSLRVVGLISVLLVHCAIHKASGRGVFGSTFNDAISAMPEEDGLYSVFALLSCDVSSYTAVTILSSCEVGVVLGEVQYPSFNALSGLVSECSERGKQDITAILNSYAIQHQRQHYHQHPLTFMSDSWIK
jgi:hypothetical protein